MDVDDEPEEQVQRSQRLATLRKRRQRVRESEVKRQKVGEVEGEKVGTSSGRKSAQLAAKRNATKAARSAESAEQRSGFAIFYSFTTWYYNYAHCACSEFQRPGTRQATNSHCARHTLRTMRTPSMIESIAGDCVVEVLWMKPNRYSGTGHSA